MYSRGDCINKDTNRSEYGVQAHNFIVVVGGDAPTDRVLMFPLDRIKEGRVYDSTTIINPGEHVFVTEPTFINYGQGWLGPVKTLDDMVAVGEARIKKDTPFSNDLVQRVADGITPGDTPFILRSFYQDFLLGVANSNKG